ncbi:MAG TPA: gluconate:H+ symporter [Saprospiraceae bacterium]|nr:gluconate:H+ symporter [Saprospiraceae bacterium]
MVFLPIIVGIIVLVLLVTWLKLDTFISFILVCLLVGLWGGLSLGEAVAAIQQGIGNTLGSLVIILGFGAMLGKLLAESGGAKKITHQLVDSFGMKNIQMALIVTGFIVGIPMFYSVGFVILVPLAIAIAHETKLSLLYVGLPMLASLSVTHGFLPPHPAPTAISEMYQADLGMTLLYGMIVGIPAILSAKFILSGTMKRIQPTLLKEFVPVEQNEYRVPPVWICLLVALLPVLLIAGSSLLGALGLQNPVIAGIGNPSIAMLIAVLAAVYFLGVRTGRPMADVSRTLASSISGIAVVLLVIAGAGALKQILVATDVSTAIGDRLGGLGLSPIIMAWLIAAIIRVSVGSATVAGLTAAGIMTPLVATSGVAPELLVLATGAGSITFSHINDSGFWLYKEYFNLSVKETLQSWTFMETTVSVVGLIGVLILNLFV